MHSTSKVNNEALDKAKTLLDRGMSPRSVIQHLINEEDYSSAEAEDAVDYALNKSHPGPKHDVENEHSHDDDEADKDIGNPLTLSQTKKAANNPWAICTASVGRDSSKFEDCVMSVKQELGIHKDETEEKYCKAQEYRDGDMYSTFLNNNYSAADPHSQYMDIVIDLCEEFELTRGNSESIVSDWIRKVFHVDVSAPVVPASLFSDDNRIHISAVLSKFGNVGVGWKPLARKYLKEQGLSTGTVEEIITSLSNESGQLDKSLAFKRNWGSMVS